MRNGRRRVLTYHSVSGASARRLPLEQPEPMRRPTSPHSSPRSRPAALSTRSPSSRPPTRRSSPTRSRQPDGSPHAGAPRSRGNLDVAPTRPPHSVYACACAMRDARCARALPHEAGHGRSSNACAGCRRAHARRRDARHAQPQYVTRARTNSGGGGSNGGDGGGDNSDGKGLQL